jgi:hypothetical protein
MGKSEFDTLTRLLTTPGSRRSALAALGGMIGARGWRGVSDAALAKRHKKKKKKKRGRTTSPPSPPSSLTCPSPYTPCGAQCVDLSDNQENCGACAVVCSQTKTCCSGVCIDLNDNDANCGSCGHACLTRDEDTTRLGAAEICSSGTCAECSVQGSIRMGNPPTCCRGLHRCFNDMGRNECVPNGTPC